MILPPPKKAPKVAKKKNPVIVVEKAEEVRELSPVLSQSDLARKKLAALKAAGETAEAKRLEEQGRDKAAFEAAAAELEACVLKETKPKPKVPDGRRKRTPSRSRSPSSEHRRSRSPRRRSRSPRRRSRSPNRRRSRSPDRDLGRKSDKDRGGRSYGHTDRRSETPRRVSASDDRAAFLLQLKMDEEAAHAHASEQTRRLRVLESEDPLHGRKDSSWRDRRAEAPRRVGDPDRRRSRSRSPKGSSHRSRSRSPRQAKNPLETPLPNGADKGSSRKVQSKERSSGRDRRSRSPPARKEVSSNDESGDDPRISKGFEERSGKDYLFARAVSIPDEVEQMAKVIAKMDQICTGVAVRAAMLLDAVVNLLPSGSKEHERGSLFASYVRNSSGSGAASIQASSFGLEKLGQAILSGLCLRIVRRILLCSTADIPIMAFSAANAVILGAHDPSLPKPASKDSRMVDCSPHTTFDELMLFLVRWARVVNLVDPVYGSAISGLTCVVIELHANRESVIVIHEYIQIMKKLVTAGEGGDVFFPSFFTLQPQTLEQARLAVAEKARTKASENKAGVELGPGWIPKGKPKGLPKGLVKPTWAAPVGRDKAAIMEAGVTMTDEQIKSSSCHGWNNGTACSKLSPEGNCYFSHVCNVCLSSKHGRSACPKRSAKKE